MSDLLFLVKTIINAFLKSQRGCFKHKWMTKHFILLNLISQIISFCLFFSTWMTRSKVSVRCLVAKVFSLAVTHSV